MSLLEAETEFGLGLLRESSINSSFVFSPLSIALALSFLHAGARGSTRVQIRNLLRNDDCYANEDAFDSEVQKHYLDLSKSFTNPANGVEVNLANRLYLRNGFPVQQYYLDTIKKNYGALAQNLDFSKKQEAAKVMNDFVKETTKGKITDLVRSDTVSPDALAFLINALYIKADWQEPFEKTSSFGGDFFEAEGKTRKVQFMSSFSAKFDYVENSDVQVVSLKYKDASYAFNIFLPKDKFGLDKFRAGLNGKKVQELLGGLHSTRFLNFRIPKMKIESELSLKTSLQKLGITDVFSDKADLSGIAQGVKISEGAHKAIIEVDEEGTTASAATYMKAVPLSGFAGELKNFIADHPFLFVLTKNNHPVFIGTQY